MKKKRWIFVLLALLAFRLSAAEWQWSVAVKEMVSAETDGHLRAFLWIPPTCRQVKAVVMGQHNMTEEPLFEMPSFRTELEKAGIALVWITPGLDQQWNVSTGVQTAFEAMMDELADVSGYTELKYVPIVPLGHSAMATYPWNFAAWNPERTLAVVSFHGDAPRTNLCGYGRENLEWGRNRNIDGIPGLMIEGEYEWWEARVNPALAFRMMYPESCISFLCDAGRGHFDISEQTASYIALFLKKSLDARYPSAQPVDRPVKLKPVRVKDGWLAERWRADGRKRAKPAPYALYRGDRHDAFWYFDREMAELTERRYKESEGKKMQYLGVVQHGKLLEYDPKLHAGIVMDFVPEADGLTFHLKGVFTDSLRSSFSDDHASGEIHVDRICGPAEKVNDTTFAVRFYRMGMYNKRRTNDIWLLASQKGDTHYKSAVQQLTMRIPYRNRAGRRQHILFPGLDDVEAGTTAVELHAVSDCGLPVYYYVKEGPAEIVGGKVMLSELPPRAKYPVKVTVVAWQYGIGGKVATAEPVERSFYINK